MTRKEITELLEFVISAYPNTRINDANGVVNAWMLALGEYPADKVYKAARLHMKINKFFPTPADIDGLIVRAEICFSDDVKNDKQLSSGGSGLMVKKNEDVDDYLDRLCKWIGFG